MNTRQVVICPSTLGNVIIAFDDNRLTDVSFDTMESFSAQKKKELIGFEIGGIPDKDVLSKVLDKLNEGVESKLDVSFYGTSFQIQVWQALCQIPSGETRTYAEVAKAIGSPKSYRAVANACGANPLAVIVPCHRVIGSDGNLGGYRWGLEMKKKLLAREKC